MENTKRLRNDDLNLKENGRTEQGKREAEQADSQFC